MIRFDVLSSGSGGNSTLFCNGRNSIAIDFGVSAKKAEEGFSNLSVPPESLCGVFLTHLHPDHVGDGLRVFLKKHPVPVYVNRYSAKKDHSSLLKLALPPSLLKFFSVGQDIVLPDFTVRPIEAFHDSPGCVSYCVSSGDSKVTLITDTGYFSDEMIERADESGCLFLESDYDDMMLDGGNYAPWLKRRIRSENGHLSNDQAMRFLSRLSDNPNRCVYLIHLSGNNNTPERAEEVCGRCGRSNRFIKAIPHDGSVCGSVD